MVLNVLKKRTTQCPLCSYRCYSKTELERHLRKHTTERPFSCSVPGCEYKTNYERNVQQHFRNIHCAERPFECPSDADGCTYKAKAKFSLDKHLETHRSLKMCKIPGCSYTYERRGSLKGHNCTREEKPWKCSVCDFRSKSKYNLMKHEDTHKKIRRYQCHARN